MSDMRMKRSNEGENDLRAEGGKTKHRYAKGGKVPKHHTNIAVVIPHHPHPMMGGGMPAPGAVPGAPPPAMGGPAPTLAPSGAPGMPPPPMRKHGGKVVMGEYPPEDISNYRQARFRKDGGKIKAGSFSGVGRLEQAERQKGREG
jgi:hypothetical protein